MSRSHGKSYVNQMLAILAEAGIVATVIRANDGVQGSEIECIVIDDFVQIGDETLKLDIQQGEPLIEADYTALEERIELLMTGRGLLSRDRNSYVPHTQQRLHDSPAVQRARKQQVKAWETKATIKSNQLRQRQRKGK